MMVKKVNTQILATFSSYQDISTWYVRGRHGARALSAWARFWYDPTFDEYELYITGIDAPILAVTPNNVVVFAASLPQMGAVYQRLASSLHKILPLRICQCRDSSGELHYFINTSSEVDQYTDQHGVVPARALLALGVEYFKGITFDLRKGTCLNMRPVFNDTVVPELRAQWFSRTAAFLDGLRVRVRIGGLDKICDDVYAIRSKYKSQWRMPQWKDEYWVDRLYRAVRDMEFPIELLVGLVESINVSYYHAERPKPVMAERVVQKLLHENSLEFQRRFGVFGKEQQDGSEDQDDPQGDSSDMALS